MPPKYPLVAVNVFGKTRWFNRGTGTGRIIFDEFGEVFVKHSSILRPVNRNGDNFLLPSQIVFCDIQRGPKGLQAINVKVKFGHKSLSFSRSGDRNHQPPSECSGSSVCSNFTSPDKSDVNVVEKDLRGEVLEFDSEYGGGLVLVQQYGKIACFSNYIDYFGTVSSKRCLQPTQIVKCDIGRARSGVLLAINVKVICEANAPAERETRNVIASDVLGEVLSYNKSRKYGFIRLKGSDNVYFNHYALKDISDVRPTQVVKFDVAQGPKSNIALNIRMIRDSEDITDSNSNPPQNPVHCYSNYAAHSPQFQTPCSKNAPPELPDILSFSSQTEPIVEKTKMLKITGLKHKTKATSSSKQKLSCNICKDGLEDAVLVPCGHLFCRECIGEWLAFNPSCPVDGRAVSRKSVKSASLVQSTE